MAISLNRIESQGKLPSQTKINLKANVSAITLRNRTVPDPKPKARMSERKEEKEAEITSNKSNEDKVEGKNIEDKGKALELVIRLPFPKRFEQSKKEQEEKEIFCRVEVNIPLLDVIKRVPRYAKFWKELCTNKKKFTGNEKVSMGENVSAMLQGEKMPPKCKDPGKAMLNLGTSINVMPYSIYSSLNVGPLKRTGVIQLADRSNVYPKGVLEDVLVQVNELVFPTDFYVTDMEEHNTSKSPLILLGRPFLKTSKTKIDVHDDLLEVAITRHLDARTINLLMKEYDLGPELKEMVLAMESNRHKKFQAPVLDLKELRDHLKYAYLGKDNTLPVIISTELSSKEEKRLVNVLEEHKEAIGWIIADIKGLIPLVCMHKILLEDDYKPFREAQRRLNPPMMEVVKKEILKLLDVGIIYSISDSKLVSPVQVVPKKTGLTVVRNTEGFYRRFIKDFSKITRLFCCLLQKDVDFHFDGECKKAFNELKDKLTSEPIIQPPNWDLPFEIMCDASNYAVRAVLGQKFGKDPHMIYYASRTLDNAQSNYSMTEKKLLAIVFALEKFCQYLLSTKVIVFSDHAALKYLMKKDAKPRLIR
ncbi:uncharacterized protein LOC112516146 [Cynara cardunculus var. scolymus]|uniref:uncharacterized protein LOC112516146 n=1 Tax=Cynara cardunculus var. scolymus TaxID=59895 RepID=UPI000D62AFBF|nr:uncharacterized protein LOC112516146 [Cynara cardunculus var. scolymus]